MSRSKYRSEFYSADLGIALFQKNVRSIRNRFTPKYLPRFPEFESNSLSFRLYTF